jgi:hypothetical protein
MIRRTGLATLLTAVGSFMLAGMAHATLYNFNAVGIPSDGQFGSYHVVVNTNPADTSFQILSIVANGGAQTPTSNVFQVRMYFYAGLNATGANIGNVSFTPGSTGGISPGNNNWGSALVSNAGGGNPAFSHYGEFKNVNQPANDLLKNGSNIWSQDGDFTIPVSAASFEMQLNDGSAYVVDVNVVPEASSLALLVPALIPMGFVLRRRYARK